jgi:uncharacterized protein (TIRG00374 family)
LKLKLPLLLKKHLVGWLKIVIPLALIVWLCRHAWQQHPDAVRTLRDGDTRPGLLAVGILAILAAHVIGTLRWHLLLRAIHIPVRLIDTLRLGFLGYLFNLISPGHVGGDLFKAVFIAREQRQRRTAAIATIVVDRVCGLYGLLVMSALALAVSRVSSISPTVAAMAGGVYVLTGLGGAAIVLMLTTPLATHPLSRRLAELPKLGPIVAQLLTAMQLYQRQRPVMLVVGLMSVLVHVLLALGVYFAARGVYAQTPPLADHFVISPVASVAGALPITPGGLGSFELALSYMYDLLSPLDARGRGIVVALLVRLAIIGVAGIGVAFYWLNHREVQALLGQAEREAQREAEAEPECPAESPSAAPLR